MGIKDAVLALKPAQLTQLADEHIKIYNKRLEVPSRHINEKDCKMYLALWKSVKTKAEASNEHARMELSSEKLDRQEIDEILDAIYCGQYEDIVGSAAEVLATS